MIKISQKLRTRIILTFVVLVLEFIILLWRSAAYAIPKDNNQDIFFRPALVKTGNIPKDPFKTIGDPVSIKISRLGIDGKIENVGLSANGSMEVPKIPMNIGWYKLGPRPGEVGSAVIAGHVDWYNGAKAIFAKLPKVKIGDKIISTDINGATTTFIVTNIKKFKAGADATEVFTSGDNKERLNIITCVGKWNKRLRQYSDRLVVFAEKENLK